MRFLSSMLTLLSVSTFALVASAAEPIACTMDAKLCPDGVTYVGRQGPDCAFAPCPVQRANTQCDPYVCSDGTAFARCDEAGTPLTYFAAPCLTHGGETDGSLFRDVLATHPNAEAIAYVKAEGIVEGYADGTYRPDQTINRAEFAKIIVEARVKEYEANSNGMGTPPGAINCFLHESKEEFHKKYGKLPDVDFNAWYGNYVCNVLRYKIAQGYPDGTFRPAANITFVEAAKIMVNAFDLEATTTISACEGECPWYRPYVLMLEMYNAIPTTITRLDQPITRGEMAEMIYRLKTKNTQKPSRTYEDIRTSKALPDFLIEDVKVENIVIGGRSTPAFFAKIRNTGAPVSAEFWLTSEWLYEGDSRWYEDQSREVSFPTGYLGGSQRFDSDIPVRTDPWTLLKTDVRSGSTVRMTVDSAGEIEEQNENNNSFTFTLP